MNLVIEIQFCNQQNKKAASSREGKQWDNFEIKNLWLFWSKKREGCVKIKLGYIYISCQSSLRNSPNSLLMFPSL